MCVCAHACTCLCAASQQNIASSCSLLWVKPISQHCVGGIVNEKTNGRIKHEENVRQLKGANLKTLRMCYLFGWGK